MTTRHLIENYAHCLRQAERWQTQADSLRDQIAKRILAEGNFANGSRATRYKVKETRVRSHHRSGFSALRITP